MKKSGQKGYPLFKAILGKNMKNVPKIHKIEKKKIFFYVLCSKFSLQANLKDKNKNKWVGNRKTFRFLIARGGTPPPKKTIAPEDYMRVVCLLPFWKRQFFIFRSPQGIRDHVTAEVVRSISGLSFQFACRANFEQRT